MAKKWSEVASSPQFMALDPGQKEQARSQYFDQVVAPQVPQDQLQAVRSQFDAETRIQDQPSVQAERPDFSGVTSTVDSTAMSPDAPRDSLFRMDSDFNQKSGVSIPTQIGAAARDMFLGHESAGNYLAQKINEDKGLSSLITGGAKVIKGQDGEPLLRLQSGEVYRLNDPGLDSTDVANVAGNVAAYFTPAGWAAKTGQAIKAGLLGRAALQAGAAGLTDAAIQEGLQGDVDLGRVATTAAGGAGGEVVGSALGGVTSLVPAARKELARRAQEFGITLTPAQLSDSRFLQYLASVAKDVPFSGAGKRAAEQSGEFNRALARTIGEDAPAINSEVYAAAKARQSQMYDDLTTRNAVVVDDKLVRRLQNIAKNAGGENKAAVDDAIQSILQRVEDSPNGGVIPGRAFQDLDSMIGADVAGGGSKGFHLKNVQTALRDALDDSISPQDQAAWRQLRKEYANRKSLTALASKADEEGMIRPASVLGAVNATKVGKEAMASGTRGELGDLARIGQLIREPPNSGTAQRGAIIGGLTGAGAAANVPAAGGAILAARLLSQGLDSRAVAKLLIRENPSLTERAAAEIVRKAAAPAASMENN